MTYREKLNILKREMTNEGKGMALLGLILVDGFIGKLDGGFELKRHDKKYVDAMCENYGIIKVKGQLSETDKDRLKDN